MADVACVRKGLNAYKLSQCAVLRITVRPAPPRQWHKSLPKVFRSAHSSSYDARSKAVMDREILVSVLEASGTKRDTKGYLQKYTAQQHTPSLISQDLTSIIADGLQSSVSSRGHHLHYAVVKIRDLQLIKNEIAEGLARTLSQLRTLGLFSIVILDCGPCATRPYILEQAYRFSRFVDTFGDSKSRVVDTAFISGRNMVSHTNRQSVPSISLESPLRSMLGKGVIPIVAPTAVSVDHLRAGVIDPCLAVLSITHFLVDHSSSIIMSNSNYESVSVERIILIDPLGGLPNAKKLGSNHRFINLEQEFESIMDDFALSNDVERNGAGQTPLSIHAKNLALARDTLFILPTSSSALITSPWAAAYKTDSEVGNAVAVKRVKGEVPDDILASVVKTRMKTNPLIHNLLTDRPVYSSSLPLQRIQCMTTGYDSHAQWNVATLVKRGMPLRIFPDPKTSPWRPPVAGVPRFTLTDSCINLPQLIYLIENSFGRKLNLDDYICRVNNNIAGIIIAGEYEGGAILTWENPTRIEGNTAPEAQRMIPYLDKFAVLKSRQGSSGVADVVFNALVGDCFPNGVCWRSRQSNTVNKWYFERSLGSLKLPNSCWTMFWTTPDLSWGKPTLQDYESVCRTVKPSWR